MKDQSKTKQVLIQELTSLRQMIEELKQSETEWKKEKKELKKSEARFRSYFDLPLYGIAITSLEKGWIQVNDRLCSIMGYSRNEIIRMTWSEMTHPDDVAADLEQFNRVLSGQINQYNMEKRFIRKDGKVIWTNLSVGCVRKPDGSVDHMVALVDDITSSKLAEEALRESEDKYRSLFNNSIDAVLLTAPDGRIMAANPEACRIFSRTEEEICQIGRAGLMDLTDPRLAVALEERTRTGQFRGELTFLRKNGASFTGEISSVIFRDRDGNSKTSMIIRDITERKRAEDAMRDAETRYRMLFEYSPDGVVIIDPATARPLEFNETAHRQLGYSREEFAALSIYDLEVVETPEETRSRIAQVIQEGQVDFETRQRTRQGEIRNVHVTAQVIEISEKQVYHCVWRDITKRKRTEEVLTNSEEKFRKAFYTSPDSVNINRLEDGMYISINPGFTRITGYTEADIIGKTSIEYDIWDNIEDRHRLVAGLRKDGEVTNLEAVFRTKNGDIRYGLMSASVIDLKGVPHILSITRDVTDRKRAEKALKESENKYRLLADNVNDVIFVLDMNLNYTYVSPSVKTLRGYEPEEVLIQSSIEKTLTPSSRDLAMRTYSEIMDLEKSGHRDINISRMLQLEMIRKDGTTIWTEVKFSIIRDENQQAVGILGLTRDITERKRTEEALKESEKKFRTLTENTPDIVSRIDRELRHVFINKAIERVTNLNAEEYLGKTNEELGMPEEILTLWNHQCGKAFATAEPVHFEYDFPSPDGIRSFFSTLVPELDAEGRVSTVLALARDITDRKQNMEKLRKALGATVQAIAVTVEAKDPYTAGHQRRVADLARSIATEMNLPIDQIDGIRMAATIHDLGKISVPAEILIKPTKLTNIEFSLIKTHSQSGYDILKDHWCPNVDF